MGNIPRLDSGETVGRASRRVVALSILFLGSIMGVVTCVNLILDKKPGSTDKTELPVGNEKFDSLDSLDT